jgi:cytidine deaminase
MAISKATLRKLTAAARKAAARAYCPYSDFRVGAALLTVKGQVYSGCNVENASYGLTICAERNAVFQMVSHGETAIAAVVIYTPTAAPTAPCGACRQVLNEFGSDAEVICTCDGPDTLHFTLSALLPQAFGPNNLS